MQLLKGQFLVYVLILFTIFLNSCSAQEPGQSNTPNVILILADDLGYNDLSSYGSTVVKTPNIDKLADTGFLFKNYRTAASICSPSRAALLTGAYPQRAGLYMGINPNREPHWFLGLNPEEITIAEQFKKQQYKTFHVGKWHLGTEEIFLSTQQGFDDYYGMPCNYDHSPKFFDSQTLVYEETPLDKLTELYTNRITSFIKENSSEPFFLFYSHNYPHTPYEAGDRFKGSSGDGTRGDIIQEFDWSVGEIVNTLKEEGILSNTIIIFTSDNGPVEEAYSEPYRGTKFVSLEGGHKVPLLFSWPDRFQQKKESTAPVVTMDIFPTLSEIIGVEMPKDRKYDGQSIFTYLKGEKEVLERNNDPFYYYNSENLQAISLGQWKMHLPRTEKQMPWWDKNKTEFTDITKPVLYDLSTDIRESRNVAEQHPEIVKSLQRMASAGREELGEYMQRGSGQRPTGTILPNVPIISNPSDWKQLPDSIKLSAKRKTK